MNISVDKKNLFKYSIHHYFKLEDKDEFIPYLWTSSYGLLRMLFLYRKNGIEKEEIEQYIKRVHSVLGKNAFTNEKLSDTIKFRLEWLKDYDIEILEVFKEDIDPLLGSLRIGKHEQNNDEEPGIYLHYTTKWIYALIKASQILQNKIYLFQACNIMLTMSEKNVFPGTNNKYPRKMDQELQEPLQMTEISHDPLDVFISLLNLIISLNKNMINIKPYNIKNKNEKKINKVREIYINLLIKALEKNIPRISEYNKNPKSLITNDTLGIGFLLTSCYKIRIIINKIRSKMLDTVFTKMSYKKNKFIKLINSLYQNLLFVSENCMREYCNFKKNEINDDAYRWFGISIGLRATKMLEQKFLKKSKNKEETELIKKLSDFYSLRNDIHNNYNTTSFKRGNWEEHKDISIVTFLYAKNPILN